MDENIPVLAAKIYTGKDWHKLTAAERQLVEALERSGHLVPHQPANGFVGRLPH